jgi:AcrR family transcriptional regulator
MSTEPPMVKAVLEVARRQLGEVGPAALSLRSIAREVGVVPSALYRYLPGREAILTELIRTGYDRLGSAVEEAEATIARQDVRGRWIAVWTATRAWAVAHPHEYALLYGTPVAGYQAPQQTIAPATRVVLTLARIAAAAPVASLHGTANATVLADAEAVIAQLPALGLDADRVGVAEVLAVIESWTLLFGAISFELFGHLRGSMNHGEEYLEHLAHATADRLGL